MRGSLATPRIGLPSLKWKTQLYYQTHSSVRWTKTWFAGVERAQDFLLFLPRRFLLIGGQRFNLHLAAPPRASAFFFSSSAFFSAARRLISSITLSLCGIAIATTPPFLLHQWGLSLYHPNGTAFNSTSTRHLECPWGQTPWTPNPLYKIAKVFPLPTVAKDTTFLGSLLSDAPSAIITALLQASAHQ